MRKQKTSMNIFEMNDVLDKVCKAWNNHDFNKTTKQTSLRQCKHKFTKYDMLGDNTKEYYCSKCGLTEDSYNYEQFEKNTSRLR
jgi:hypothetical protein